ncbi:phosphatase PAP2 family protein [Leekyejoonella antrihumi]|uniref:Phosphatase PAP2 family protein n=1 Tax=Leekyejoonella antrihumi TaxID=1660198 RepID=A0A563DZJ2_9MICO|nr:phosphatase PAP2 family protein [Leekyejoonella antrihumi]TWP35539.1 phosphatase PAP2 family protein [Leekyejoonella antrihumi]
MGLLSWQQALTVCLVAIASSVVLRRRLRRVAAILLEISILAGLFAAWQLAQLISRSGAADAFARARWIERFQHTLRLPSEHWMQHLVLGHPDLVRAENLYYAMAHFNGMGIFLLWLFFRHRDRYPAVRTTMAVSTGVCLLVAFLPVAPPRLLPGYVDTAARYGQSVYGAGLNVDELSAMPSVHVLWAVLIGWYVVRVSGSRWRFLALLYPVATVFVVVSTANHWWLDGIVAVLILVAAAWGQVGLRRMWSAWRAKANRPPTVVSLVDATPVPGPAVTKDGHGPVG